MRWIRAAAVATALMVNMGALSGLAGCSSSESSQAAQQHASTVVGAQGGSVTTQDGSGVTVPAGAVPANVTITVDSTPSAPTPSQGTEVGTPYTFGPEGQQFSVPVTVTLAFDPSSLPAGKTASDIVIFTAPAGTSNYTPLGTSVVDSTHAAAQTTHFSTFVCIIPTEPISEDSGAPAEDSATSPSDASPSGLDATATFDASQGEDGGSTSATDSGATQDATVPINDAGGSGPGDATTGPVDATAGNDAGSGGGQDSSAPVADGGRTSDDAGSGGSADSSSGCSLSGALNAPIIPLSKIAGLNMNESGLGTASLAYAESVYCGAGTFGGQEDAGADPGTTITSWAGGDISAQYNDSPGPNDLQTISVQGSYTGSLSFTSRSGGTYGTGHNYVIGVGTLTKDGLSFPIGFGGGNADAAINELFDGMMATFAPAFPVDPNDCTSDGNCLLYDASEQGDDAGVGGSVFGVRALKMYVTMASDTTPGSLYTFFTGSYGQADAGVPGVAGNGGLTIPAGCSSQSEGILGSCEDPAKAFCGNFAGTVVSSCLDYPQSGYQAVCCPPDAGQ